MDNVGSEKEISPEDLKSLRYCMRTDGKSGFVFINHYQRQAKLEKLSDVVIDTGSVIFPSIDVKGDIAFLLPFNLKTEAGTLVYATAQPLSKTEDTYFFAAIEGIEPEFKFDDGDVHKESFFQRGKLKFVTISFEEARFIRKLGEKIYIGENVDLYEESGKVKAVQQGTFSYKVWTGKNFKKFEVINDFKEPMLEITDVQEPFLPKYPEELNIGSSGFVDIEYVGDVAQIYADGELVADEFYIGEKFRIPSKLIYGKESCLVYSELKDDCYREF